MIKSSTSLLASAALLAGLFGAGAANAGVTAIHGGSVAGGVPSATSAAGDLFLNLAGQVSFDEQDAVGNTTFTLQGVGGALVDGVSYNISLATIGASWLSEATISFTNSAGDGVFLTPGFGEDHTGTGTFSDSVLLSDYGLSFNLQADGLMYVQLFEAYDDNPGAADATYTAGGVTFSGIAPVPEPGTYALMALGVAGLGIFTRRRKTH